jgi:hypothetical protein
MFMNVVIVTSVHIHGITLKYLMVKRPKREID